MAGNEIERYSPPRALPVAPVQPSPAPETPPEGQTGASLGRLAPQLPQTGAEAPSTQAATSPLDALSFDPGPAPALGVHASVENFEDYLRNPAELFPETTQLDSTAALFAARKAGQDLGSI